MNGTEPAPGTPVVRTLGMLASPEGAIARRLRDGARMLLLLIGGVETVGRFLARDGAARVPGYYTIGPRERTTMAVAYFGLLGVTFAGVPVFHAPLRAVRGGAV